MTATRLFGEEDGNNLETLLDAIESDHCAKEHPNRVSWTIEGLRVIVAQRRFKPLRSVVSDITDRAAGERDEAGTTCERTAAKVIANPLGRSTGIRFSLAVTLHKGLHALAAHDHLGLCAKERIARDPFAAFDRLQQERIRRVAGNAHERADRRVQDRHHATTPGPDIALP